MDVIFFGGVALVLVAVGYKWYRIHQLMTSRGQTPPKLWTLTLLPIAALLLAFGAIFVWTLVEWFVPQYR